jgi:hypothetical protein
VKTKPEILSKSDFAQLIGVRPSAISNYIARGQIYGDASAGVATRTLRLLHPRDAARSHSRPDQIAWRKMADLVTLILGRAGSRISVGSSRVALDASSVPSSLLELADVALLQGNPDGRSTVVIKTPAGWPQRRIFTDVL